MMAKSDARKTGADHVAQHPVPHLGVVVAGANHGHGGGLEDLVEISDAHIVLLQDVRLNQTPSSG